MLLLSLLASAAPPEDIEEVIVYADPLGPWDGTRWYVASEAYETAAPLSVTTPEGVFTAPFWQIEAVLRCRVDKRRPNDSGLVKCSPESVAIRAATAKSWARETDRARVDAGLASIVGEVMESDVTLRIRRVGHVRMGKDDDFASTLTHRLLSHAVAAFHLDLPKSGALVDEQWVGFREPLLGIGAVGESFGIERVAHVGSQTDHGVIIQTIAESHKDTVINHSSPPDTSPEKRFSAANAAAEPSDDPLRETVVRTKVHMDGVAAFDRDQGFVTERVWSVRGTGGIPFFRSGVFRLLDDDEQIVLRPSGQVSPPGMLRADLAAWTPVDPAL